jgi:hypothetical protein
MPLAADTRGTGASLRQGMTTIRWNPEHTACLPELYASADV